jgi:hypothetical protein
LEPPIKVAAALRPLDAARRLLLRQLTRFSLGRRLVNDQGARISAQAIFGISLSLLLTLVWPLGLLALGPLLWGVPHLAADLRYLVARRESRSLSRSALAPVLALLAVQTLLRAARVAWSVEGGAWDALEISLGGAAAAIGAATATGGVLRRSLVALAFGATSLLAWQSPALALLAVAHGHNLVAFVFYLRSARRRGAKVLLPTLLYFSSLALLASGLAPLPSGALEWAGIEAGSFARQLAPAWLSDAAALRLLATFAFAQSVHYLSWLRLVPESELPRRTPLTFRASWHALLADLGRPLVAATAALTLAFLVAAAGDFARARYAYLSIAVFHGYLELASLAAWAATSRATSGTRSAA